MATLVVLSIVIFWLSIAGVCGWLLMPPPGPKLPRDWCEPL